MKLPQAATTSAVELHENGNAGTLQLESCQGFNPVVTHLDTEQ